MAGALKGRGPVHHPLAIGATFAVYLVAMLAIGAGFYRTNGDLSDYLLGGRRLNRWVTALSAGASDMSGWLLLGLPGYAYTAGLQAGWIALGLLTGTYLNWRVVAGRLRRYTELAGDAITLSDFLERRFADDTRLLRGVSALFILVFYLLYTASGLVAGGKLFAAVFGLPYYVAVLAGAAVIVGYTFLGGFLAVCWTDLVQGLLMAAALVVVPIAALHAAGGWAATGHAMAAVDPALLDPLRDVHGRPLTAIAVVSLLAWGLGYFGQPHILVRFMAIRSHRELPGARRIAMGWVSVSLTGALLVGFAGIAYLHPALTGPDTEKVFIRLVGALFHPVPAGILLAAILAAIMSTADSQLLVASSALAEDFYKGRLRRAAGARELLWVARGAVLLIAGGALWLARDPDSRVLELVAYAWAGFGAAFGPALLLSLFWPRMTARGALAGMLTGGVTVIVWHHLSGGIFDLYGIVPGFVLSALAVVGASLLDRPPDAGVRALFERVRAGG